MFNLFTKGQTVKLVVCFEVVEKLMLGTGCWILDVVNLWDDMMENHSQFEMEY